MHPLSKVAHRTECIDYFFGVGTLLAGHAFAFTAAAMDNSALCGGFRLTSTTLSLSLLMSFYPL